MNLKRLTAVAVAIGLSPTGALAQDHAYGDADAPYAELQTRAIASLSDDDIAELQRGGGWGLALPAELNGMPGPAHLLELQDELGLSTEQVLVLEGIFEEMRAEAIAAGERFIAAEARLDAAFESGDLDDTELLQLIEAATSARADLRFVHLSRHLATLPLLSEAQIRQYAVLRGYADDPCATVPGRSRPGHVARPQRLRLRTQARSVRAYGRGGPRGCCFNYGDSLLNSRRAGAVRVWISRIK